MNTRLQLVPQAIPVALLLIALVSCRLWLGRQTNATQAKYRVLGIGQGIIGVAFIAVMIANLLVTSSPNWILPFCLILVFALVAAERARLRKQGC
jgi:hypothetical protein